MNQQALIISVRLLDDRYHGSGSWPPSPFRLYQALVAAAYTGSTASETEVAALRWLEQLPPPVVLSQKHKQSTLTTYYVPRNGADAQQGNLAAAAKNRDAKLDKPWLFDARQPLQYVWFFDEQAGEAETLIQLSERVYQLGRGLDMAFAWAEQLASDKAQQIIIQHAGPVFRPTPQGVSNTLDCHSPNQSFDSLVNRYRGQSKRLRKGEFHKPPLPVFEPTGYNCPSSLLLFDIQNQAGELIPQPFTSAGYLTQRLVELAKQRLKPHYPEYAERYISGMGAKDSDKALRIRVIPLSSIGHEYTQADIRRVLVEVPTDCPLHLVDVEWAFSGLPVTVDLEIGEIVTACKYHVVWIPKYRKKALYVELRKHLGELLKDLAAQKECKILEGHLVSDHVHMLISIPPKYSVSQVVGFIKGKSAIAIARNYMGRKKNFIGQSFWARGYYVSTVGKDEEIVREYIKHQEEEDRRIEQLSLF